MTRLEQFRNYLFSIDPIENPIYAVLDGAQFDDLPKALFDGDFIHRPLYKDTKVGDHNIEQTAPQLVMLNEREDNLNGRSYKDVLEALLTLIDDKPAAVFWRYDAGYEALYKHLRSINMVMIPKEGFEKIDDEESEDTAEKESHELVTFRHADPNVMAQVLPALNLLEISRLIGNAERIVLLPDEEWGNKDTYFKASAPEDLPRPATGYFQFSEDTIMRIEKKRGDKSTKKICSYLREVIPQATDELSDEELLVKTNEFIDQARKLGVTSEAAFGRWCYMQLISQEKLHQKNEVHDFMARHNLDISPNEKIKLLMQESLNKISRRVL